MKKSKKFLAAIFMFILLFAGVSMLFDDGQSLLGRAPFKKDSKDLLFEPKKKREMTASENKVPTCKFVSETDVEDEFISVQSDLLQLMMGEVEGAMLSTDFWDDFFLQEVSNPLITSIETVAVSFDGGGADWVMDGGGIHFDLVETSSVYSLSDSFLSLSQFVLFHDNDFEITIDIALFDNRTFRVTGNPIGSFWLIDYFDVHGTFDFKDRAIGSDVFPVGNGIDLYGGDYFAYPNAAANAGNNLYNFSGLDNISVVRLYANGSEAEVTDPVVLAVVDLFEEFNFNVALENIMSASDYDNFLRDTRDASSIMHARKILENAASYSHKDNLRALWVKGADDDFSVYVCDYGQMRWGPIHSQKPQGKYVQHGVDYGF